MSVDCPLQILQTNFSEEVIDAKNGKTIIKAGEKINFLSALNCTSLIISHMKDYNFGRIINFGSAAAIEGMGSAGPYIISKSAVHALTKTIAKELSDYNITCNAILPGIIDTQANRVAMPNEPTDDWVSMNSIFNSITKIISSNDNGFLLTI